MNTDVNRINNEKRDQESELKPVVQCKEFRELVELLRKSHDHTVALPRFTYGYYLRRIQVGWTICCLFSNLDSSMGPRRWKERKIARRADAKLSHILLGEKIPLDVVNAATGEIIIRAGRTFAMKRLRKLAVLHEHVDIDPSPIRNKVMNIISSFKPRFAELEI
jgi:hypothetical protein